MLHEMLDNWTAQRSKLAEMSETDLKSLIALELKGRARTAVCISAHQRQCKLRTERERAVLTERMLKKQAKIKAAEKK
ncbi:hypothetical protein N9980_00830 [bacterium]|nr:hypothetical protein [bacterium]